MIPLCMREHEEGDLRTILPVWQEQLHPSSVQMDNESCRQKKPGGTPVKPLEQLGTVKALRLEHFTGVQKVSLERDTEMPCTVEWYLVLEEEEPTTAGFFDHMGR